LDIQKELRSLVMEIEDLEQAKVDGGCESVCRMVFSEASAVVSVSGREALTPGQLTVYSVEIFFGQVCGGGLQSFLNGAYDWVVPYTSSALLRVGLPEYSEFLDKALEKLFPDGIPEGPDAYDRRIEEIYDAFNASELNTKFADPFEVHEDGFWLHYNRSPERFHERMSNYIFTHQGEFVLPRSRR
jgi:hypothetical protein